MQKNYDNTTTEPKIYEQWEKSGAFSPTDNLPPTTDNYFSIIMPPPNANDPLHVGHAMFISLEDILIRYHRMKGDKTVWIPGTDHAGIETQFVFEKKLAKQGQSRFNFDRKTLYDMIWEYVQENSGVAIDQMKKLGASADWSRYHFTLDPEVVNFVVQTFEKLHKDNLVYRDLKLVNFCTKCGTSYSELEVNHVEQTSPLYYVKYRLAENPDEYVTVATTRPEPIFIDTHLAVHPDNPKTKHLIGKKVLNPITDAEMEIIADEFVDPEFGTGIVKLTPAHDFNDFEVAKNHHLPILNAITLQGKIVDTAPEEIRGLKVKAARQKVVEILKEKGLIEKINDAYQNRVGTCYRCGTVIEPLPLPQFFIKVKPLTKKALKALDAQETKVYGTGREKILRHWLENLKDWNISRQIVWGIRLPVWYCVEENPDLQVRFLDKSGEMKTGVISEMMKTHSFKEIENGLQQLHAPADAKFEISTSQPSNQPTKQPFLQETDTFDTWFSSGQWPVVTLKTPASKLNERQDPITLPSAKFQDDNKTDTQATKQPTNLSAQADQLTDFENFYPTTVMETGYDILPFWVMRMMMMGIYLTGKTPFKHVYLHGLVRDEKGQKMSKSKGNVLNPIDLSNKYGADAVRMALVMSSTPGTDSAVGENKIRGMRNFSNKIWNAARFVLVLTGKIQLENPSATSSRDKKGSVILERSYSISSSSTPDDEAFYTHLSQVIQEVSRQLDDLKIGLAAETAYNEFWHWFCDECIEKTKQGRLSQEAIIKGLIAFLKLLHPFVPFVTEAVWQELKAQKLVEEEWLITARWPE